MALHCAPQLDAVLVMGHPRGPDAALAVVLAAVVVVGVLDGLCQGAIFGDAASQPSEYTHVRCFCRSAFATCQASLLLLAVALPRSLPVAPPSNTSAACMMAHHVPHA